MDGGRIFYVGGKVGAIKAEGLGAKKNRYC